MGAVQKAARAKSAGAIDEGQSETGTSTELVTNLFHRLMFNIYSPKNHSFPIMYILPVFLGGGARPLDFQSSGSLE